MTGDQYVAIAQEVAAIKESLKSAHKRIDENDALTSQIHKLAASVEKLAFQVQTQNTQMEKVVSELGGRIGALEAKPAKRWESIVEKVLLVVVGGVVTFMLTKMGL